MKQDYTLEAKIGTIAPDFRLAATTGEQIALSDFRDKSNLVLFFVREFN